MSTILIIMVLYMALLFGISGWTAAKQKGGDSEQFLLAGRNLPFFLVATMVTGSAVGGSSTIGVAQNAFNYGISAGFYNVAWAIGAMISGLFFVNKIRAAGFRTPNQMFREVYGNAFGTVTLIVLVTALTMNTGNQIVSAGAIMTGIMPNVFDLNKAMLLAAILFVGIALLGGMWGASLTSIVNVVVIYVGTVAATIAVLHNNGGVAGLLAALPVTDKVGQPYTWFNPLKGAGTAVMVAWIFNLIVSAIDSGGIFQSVVSSKSPREGRKGVILAAFLIAPAGYACGILGTAGRALFPNLTNTKLVLPKVLETVPAWASGLCLSGLWAAVISTAVSIIIGVSVMVTKDIFARIINPGMPEKQQVLISRLVMIGMGAIGLFIGMRLTNLISTIMAALSLMTPLAVLMVGFFLLPPKFSRKSTCWWAWGMGSAAYLACTFINPAWKVAGQVIYTTLIFTVLGYIISLLADKRLAKKIGYAEKVK